MFLSGSKDATLQQVQMVDIHGTVYCDVVYTHDGEQQMHTARIGKEDIYADPQPGDAVRVSYVMNVVTRVQRRDTPA
jgi:predicted alpha/beta superfamily hydrolase